MSGSLEQSMETSSDLVRAEVVKLDRGFPLVRLDDGREVRCEHATELQKGGQQRAVVGDIVQLSWPEGHDKAIISAIEPRSRELSLYCDHYTFPLYVHLYDLRILVVL